MLNSTNVAHFVWCEGLSTVGSRLRMAGSLFEGNDTQWWTLAHEDFRD